MYVETTFPSGPAVWLGPMKRFLLGGSTSNVMGSPGRKPPAASENGVPTGPFGGETARVPARVAAPPPNRWRPTRPQAGADRRAGRSAVTISRTLHGVAGGVSDMAGRARIGGRGPRPCGAGGGRG